MVNEAAVKTKVASNVLRADDAIQSLVVIGIESGGGIGLHPLLRNKAWNRLAARSFPVDRGAKIRSEGGGRGWTRSGR